MSKQVERIVKARREYFSARKAGDDTAAKRAAATVQRALDNASQEDREVADNRTDDGRRR